MIKVVIRARALGLLLVGAITEFAFADDNSLNLKPTSDTSFLAQGLWSLFIGFGLLVLAGGCLIFWKRRVAPALTTGQDQKLAPMLKATRRLSQKTTLYVVQWRGQSYLLVETSDGVVKLAEAADEELSP